MDIPKVKLADDRKGGTKELDDLKGKKGTFIIFRTTNRKLKSCEMPNLSDNDDDDDKYLQVYLQRNNYQAYIGNGVFVNDELERKIPSKKYFGTKNTSSYIKNDSLHFIGNKNYYKGIKDFCIPREYFKDVNDVMYSLIKHNINASDPEKREKYPFEVNLCKKYGVKDTDKVKRFLENEALTYKTSKQIYKLIFIGKPKVSGNQNKRRLLTEAKLITINKNKRKLLTEAKFITINKNKRKLSTEAKLIPIDENKRMLLKKVKLILINKNKRKLLKKAKLITINKNKGKLLNETNLITTNRIYKISEDWKEELLKSFRENESLAASERFHSETRYFCDFIDEPSKKILISSIKKENGNYDQNTDDENCNLSMDENFYKKFKMKKLNKYFYLNKDKLKDDILKFKNTYRESELMNLLKNALKDVNMKWYLSCINFIRDAFKDDKETDGKNGNSNSEIEGWYYSISEAKNDEYIYPLFIMVQLIKNIRKNSFVIIECKKNQHEITKIIWNLINYVLNDYHCTFFVCDECEEGKVEE